MDVYRDDRSQINESWLLNDRLGVLLSIRLFLFSFSSVIWWFQIYESDSSETGQGEYNFVHLASNWKYLTLVGVNMTTFYFFLAIMDMFSYITSRRNNNSKNSGQRDVCSNVSSSAESIWNSLWKLEHFAFHLAYTSALTILLLFWGGVYPDMSEKSKNDSWQMMNSIFCHGVIFVLLQIEFAVNNIAFKWKHFYLVLAALVVYLIANLIVTLTGEPVYKVMTWKSVMSYVFIAVATLFIVLHFAFGKYIYEKVKLKVIDAKQALLQQQMHSQVETGKKNEEPINIKSETQVEIGNPEEQQKILSADR